MRLTGRIVRAAERDSMPLPAIWVVLHEVRMQGGQPIDSVRTDGSGRYRFGVARPDTGALYLISASHHGLAYFTQAVVPRRAPDSLPPLFVFDTSSVAPSVTPGQRHVVIRAQGAGGGRSVLELVTLVNRGVRTRISADSVTPVWAGRLPAGVEEFQVGESDVSAQAILRRRDSVVVTAPIPPGEKQVVFTYRLRAGREFTLPVSHPTERLLVLLEDTGATLVSGPLERRGIEEFEDTQFAVFDGSVPPGVTSAVFRFTRSGLTANALAVGVAGLAAVILLLAIPLLRRRGAALPALAETPDALARAIALLDQEFEAGGDRGPERTAAYQERRRALKARLEQLLAARRPPP